MNEVDFSKVGLKMKQLRSERGITQEQVAKDLQGDGLWLLDEDGKSVEDAILWIDGRASSYIEKWEKEKIIKMLRIWQEK